MAHKLIMTRRHTRSSMWRVGPLIRYNRNQFAIGRLRSNNLNMRGPHISIDLHGRGTRIGYEWHNYDSSSTRSFSFWFTNPRAHRWYAFHVCVYLPDRKGRVRLKARDWYYLRRTA